MPNNFNIIILDTSCLILLNKIDEIDLLNKVGQKVYITSTIRTEFSIKLPDWILTAVPDNNHYQDLLRMDLDKGEASAIALSLETEGSILILDDLKGRKIADRLNLKYSGTLGLILRAKKSGIIKSVKPVLDKIKSTDFRVSNELLETVRKQAGE